jgi:hypothetical protein
MSESVLNRENMGRGFMHVENLGSAQLIILAYCTFFAGLGAWQLVNGSINAFDSFLAAAMLVGAFYVSRAFVVRPISAFLTGLVFVPNMIGQAGMYAYNFYNYHWDWVVHPVAAFCFTIACIFFLLDNQLSRSFARAALVTFMTVGAIGALVEMTEYWGFRIVGFGEGYLGFGDGDNSSHFGPWENSSLDTTCNFLGSIAGILLAGVILLFSKEKFISSHSAQSVP